MAKVQILGHGARLEDALEVLYRLRVLQIIDAREEPLSLSPPAGGERRAERIEELRRLRVRLDAFLQLVPEVMGPADGTAPAHPDLRLLAAELDRVGPAVEASVRRLDELRDEEAVVSRHLGLLRRLLPLLPEVLDASEAYETVALVLERRHADVLELLRDELARTVGPRHEVIPGTLDPDTVGAVVVFPRSASATVHAWLGRERVSQLRLPPRYAGLPLRRALAAMEERLAEIPREIAAVEEGLRRLLSRRAAAWRAGRRAVDDALAKLEAVARTGSTGHAFVIVGWCPRPRLPELRRALSERVGPDVVLVEVPIAAEERDRVPLLLSNPAPVRPFEFLVRLLALPRYGTFDPSGLMALFLPLFFGMMLGDVVYGLVLAGLALGLRRRFGARSPAWRSLSSVLLAGAAWAVGWGIVYGEALGDAGRRLGLRPLWIGREEALPPLLLFAVAVGACHVALGLLLGLWVSWRLGSRRGMAERAGTLSALAGLFLLAAVAARRLPPSMATPGVAALVAGLSVLLAAGGPVGLLVAPLEILGVVGNILSYLRIAALGLASVYLARVANELAGALAPAWLGVLVAALLHALNVALGAFSPTIQALRLHYVEFFTKFFEGGGRDFVPFGPGPEGPAAVIVRGR